MLALNILRHQGVHCLQLNITLPGSGITAVFGVSGAGKTTLINIIAGLIHPQQGSVYLNDRVLVDTGRNIFLPPEQRRVGYAFQDARLFPHYRVRGNLQYGMVREMRPRFNELVELLGIGALLDRFPASLSGGEKQRVAIGRALLTAPQILLLDEPLASLDLPRKREVLPWLQQLARQVKIPILYVSHSLDEILQLADHVLVLDNGQAIARGSLEEVWNSEAMRLWLPQGEQSSVLHVQVREHHPHYAMSALALGDQSLWVPRIDAPVQTALRIRIQAKDISLVLQPPAGSSIRNVLPAQVIALLDVEQQVEVKLRVGGSELWARITPWARDELRLRPGMWLFAQIKGVSVTP